MENEKRHVNSKSSDCFMKAKVVIIGAGIAGLAAAKVLHENNVDFIVVEAQDYVGGRIKSEVCEDGIVEYGAQWLHGVQNNLKKYADDNHLLSNEVSNEGCGKFVRQDGYIFNSNTVAKVDFVVGEILSRCEKLKSSCDNDLSVGEFLENEFKSYIQRLDGETSRLWQQLFQWHLKFQAIDNSCESINMLSAARWGDYDFNGDESQSHINFKNGFSSIVDAIRSSLPVNRIWLNKPVTKILWDCPPISGNLEVHCSDDSVIVGDHVICTVSLGVLKEEHQHMFHPPLPVSVAAAIDALGFGTVAKIFLQFEYAWWGDTEGFQIVPDLDEQNAEWYKDISGFDVLNVGKPDTLMGWIGSNGAKIMETLSEEEVAFECVRLLKNISGMNIAPLKSIKRSMWFSNRFVRGGYSHMVVRCNAAGVTPSSMMQPVRSGGGGSGGGGGGAGGGGGGCGKPTLLFAGEACHDSHFSTTHGAYETGEIQAQYLVDYINSSSPSQTSKETHQNGY